MFKLVFKQYKCKSTSPDLTEVVKIDDCVVKGNDQEKSDNVSTRSVAIELWFLHSPQNIVQRLSISNVESLQTMPGVKSPKDWRTYTLTNHPGIIVIRNPFSERGRRYWSARCLRDFPRTPNIVNLNERLFDESVRSDWWKQLNLCSDGVEFQRIKSAMRWTTFGYHHNWDTKIYDEEMQSPFPEDLSSLCGLFAQALGYADFKPEAAIVNYYPVGSTLSGHTDHSEPNKSAPLFSFR